MYSVLILLFSVLIIVVTTVRFKLHPFLALLLAAITFGLLSGMDSGLILESLRTGFGDTIGSIGIVIIAGTLIGTFLEKSGGALVLARRLLKITGVGHLKKVLALVGWTVSIPVFCDSGFVILLPLTKALSRRSGVAFSGCVVALVLGLYGAHNMVPPTPGPTAAAGIIGANLGIVIAIGVPVSLFALTMGWLFSHTYASRITLLIKDVPDQVQSEDTNAPVWWKALLPIFVPLILIMIKAFLTVEGGSNSTFTHVIIFIGDPVIALLIGLLLALALPHKLKLEHLSPDGWVGKGLLDAAVIIMITGAGGAFGKMLQNSEVTEVIGSLFSGGQGGYLIPFLIAAALKTSQGSSTVALITTASLVAPMVSNGGYDSEASKALLVIAIGAGSALVSHANDSFFWIVSQMSGMNTRQGYQLISLGSLVLGTSAFLLVILLSLFL